MIEKELLIKSNGFILLEILIFVILSSFFFILLFQFTAQTYIKYNSFRNFNTQMGCAKIAIDLITNDIRKSSLEKIILKKDKKNSSLILYQSEKNNYSVNWLVKNDNLYRIFGIYNRLLNSWINITESLVCSKIKNFRIELSKPNSLPQNIKIVRVIIDLNIDKKVFTLQKSISPRNMTIII